MVNERGAGRKPQITSEQLEQIIDRNRLGESIAKLAAEYGVSRQALYARINARDNAKTVQIDYLVDGDCATRLLIDIQHKNVQIQNMITRVSAYAFGITGSPTWDDFESFLEKLYLQGLGVRDEEDEMHGDSTLWMNETGEHFSLQDVLEVAKEKLKVESDASWISEKIFTIRKQDILYFRTDTDGFQCKALSKDRKWLIKAQAVISSILMNDWKVELLASNLCKQLDIPCVEQRACQVIYGDKKYHAVYSRNFELDGYEFLSFESLIGRTGLSTYDQEFVHLDAIGKLEWCARELSEIGMVPYEDALKYMIDLAVIDCLVGNVDRHMRNFGLFYDMYEKVYKIPLLFDNGMGLFEHDPYRDTYADYESAMKSVYISPYGEDPFDMMVLLDKRYGLKSLYPELRNVQYPDWTWGALAKEYIDRMGELIR